MTQNKTKLAAVKAKKTTSESSSFTPRVIMGEISRHKKLLAENHAVLVDHSLPSAGPFDSGRETIASVTKPSQAVGVQQFLFMCCLMLRPKCILDIGTGVGVSSAYLAAAQKCSGVEGIVETIDASPYRTRIATQLHGVLGLDNVHYSTGIAREVLPNVLERSGKFDFALIDADHGLKPFLWFYEMLIKAAAPGALLVFTGVEGTNEGVKAAWNRMRNDPRSYSSATSSGLGLIYKR